MSSESAQILRSASSWVIQMESLCKMSCIRLHNIIMQYHFNIYSLNMSQYIHYYISHDATKHGLPYSILFKFYSIDILFYAFNAPATSNKNSTITAATQRTPGIFFGVPLASASHWSSSLLVQNVKTCQDTCHFAYSSAFLYSMSWCQPHVKVVIDDRHFPWAWQILWVASAWIQQPSLRFAACHNHLPCP